MITLLYTVGLMFTFLAIFLLGWFVSTAAQVTYAYFTGGNPEAVLRAMLEEW